MKNTGNLILDFLEIEKAYIRSCWEKLLRDRLANTGEKERCSRKKNEEVNIQD